MTTRPTCLALGTFFSIATCVSHAEDPKRVAVIDYPTAQKVMSQQIDPGKHSSWMSALASLGGPAFSTEYEIYAHRDSIMQLSTSVYKSLFDLGKISKDDVKNVTTIIESGRTNHVDQMEIGLSREQFLGLKGVLPAPQGTTVSFEIGSSGKTSYTIKVKYREDSSNPNK